MLNIAVVGIGNAGNQVAELAKKEYGVPGVAINSSEKDIATLQTVEGLIVGDEKGAGKDRRTAKEFMRDGVRELLEKPELRSVIKDNEIIFIVSSTGGGTGSGMSPVLREILSKVYPSKHFILVGILPPLAESIAAQQNSIEYLKELTAQNPVFMLYDNNNITNTSMSNVMKTINRELVEDLVAIRGDYQLDTPYNSIDEKDMLRIIETPGRIVVNRVTGFKEKDIDVKSIEQRLIDTIKNSTHSEIDRDKIVKRQGLIINLNETLYESLDTNLPDVRGLIGEAIEGFEHVHLNDNVPSRVVLITSGMSVPDDRITKVVQRIEEATVALTLTKNTSVLGDTDVSLLNELRRGDAETPNEPENGKVDLDDVFSKYLV